MNKIFSWLGVAIVLSTFTLQGCIKDDFIDDRVEPQLRIANKVDSIAIQTTYQFEGIYLNNVGLEERADVIWQSSDPSVVTISEQGLAEALTPGTAMISLEIQEGAIPLRDVTTVVVGENTVTASSEISGEIKTTSSYLLEGNFTLSEADGNLQLDIADNYRASTALPGLYIYLTNNRNSIANALEIGSVKVFSGTHSYTIENASISEYSYILYYCKPFNIKVGEGKIQ